MSELRFREARRQDVPGIVELLNVALGTPRSAAFFVWKHFDNPFGRSILQIAEDGKRVVGLRAFLRWDWRRRGEVLHSVRAVDTAVHPSFQRRGLFSMLTRSALEIAKEDGISFVFNTPNPVSRKGYLKLGWSLVGRTPLLVKLQRPVRCMAAMLRSMGSVARQDRQVDLESASPGALERSGRSDFGDYLAEWVQSDRLETARSAEFLVWRYGSIPGFDYQIASSGNEEERALIVSHHKSRNGLSEGKVSELLFNSQNQNSCERAEGLLRRVLGLDRYDYLIAAAAPKSNRRRILRKAGFIPARWVAPILTAKQVGGDIRLRELIDSETWGVQLGDLEVF